MSNLGEFIQQKRLEKDISIRQLAKYTGVSAAYISQIENNYRRNPTAHVLRSLADGLGIPYETFLLELNKITKTEISERQYFYEQHIDNEDPHTEYRERDLYKLLTNESSLYYKGKLLTADEINKVRTILQTLLD
ncbi:MAG TPA: helix-turn-helix transcriptional regulator [Pseudogracilibacillus sp.]|nr:helix-turn-helix transcriptional regulator [Pseudogracilibacillus sp.]